MERQLYYNLCVVSINFLPQIAEGIIWLRGILFEYISTILKAQDIYYNPSLWWMTNNNKKVPLNDMFFKLIRLRP